MEKEISIYIHIPFCKSKCFYCDFTSNANCPDEIIKNYIDALCQEILSYAEIISQRKVKTIYIGGGTPSFIDSKYIERILETIYMLTDKSCIEEITIEVNPCTLTKEKSDKYYEIGINRISLGLQTIYDDILKTIGRKHSYSDFIAALNFLNASGFKNISCDLIYPLPGLNIKLFEEELDKIINLKDTYNIKHISIYNLEVHEGTKLDFLLKEKYIALCDEDEEYEMRETLNNKLNDAGYKKYEISNYSLPGYESKHNLTYWNQNEYLGFGINASSYINGTRYTNIRDMDKYIFNVNSKIAVSNIEEEQDTLSQMKEYIILNLRKSSGILKNNFTRKFDKDIYGIFNTELQNLINAKLLIDNGEYIKLSKRGEEVANIVWEKFI